MDINQLNRAYVEQYYIEQYEKDLIMNMKPHKHAELIKAWADGAEIEWQDIHGYWKTGNPRWNPYAEYRIKPEPKPDVETYRKVILLNDGTGILYATMDNNPFTGQNPNMKFTFDGETGELKSAEVLK